MGVHSGRAIAPAECLVATIGECVGRTGQRSRSAGGPRPAATLRRVPAPRRGAMRRLRADHGRTSPSVRWAGGRGGRTLRRRAARCAARLQGAGAPRSRALAGPMSRHGGRAGGSRVARGGRSERAAASGRAGLATVGTFGGGGARRGPSRASCAARRGGGRRTHGTGGSGLDPACAGLGRSHDRCPGGESARVDAGVASTRESRSTHFAWQRVAGTVHRRGPGGRHRHDRCDAARGSPCARRGRLDSPRRGGRRGDTETRQGSHTGSAQVSGLALG